MHEHADETPSDPGDGSVSPSAWRLRSSLGGLVAALVAAAAILVPLSVAAAPTHDDFLTLEYARQPTVGDIAELYGRSDNALPRANYKVSWAWGAVVGNTVDSHRTLALVSWLGMAAGIAFMMRRLGPFPVLLGSLFPTLTPLADRAIALRGYALTLCLLTWATAAWRSDWGRRGSMVSAAAIGSLVTLSILLHPMALLYAFCLVAATLATDSGTRRRYRVIPLLGAIVCTAPIWLGSASATVEASAGGSPAPLSIGAPWQGLYMAPSLGRTALPFFVGLIAAVVIVGPASAWRRLRNGGSGDVLALVAIAGIALPAVAGLGFWFATSPYYHRYSASLLIPMSLLVGLVAKAISSSLAARSVAIGASLVSLVLVFHALSGQFVQVDRAKQLADDLSLDSGRFAQEVFVLDEYTYSLLREYSDDHVAARVRLASGPTAGPISADHQVDLPDEPFVLVSTEEDLARVAGTSQRLGRTVLRYNGLVRPTIASLVCPAEPHADGAPSCGE